jgi:hypothetical protein
MASVCEPELVDALEFRFESSTTARDKRKRLQLWAYIDGRRNR